MTTRPPVDLTDLDEAFAQASAPGPERVPDGSYLVEVASVELRQTRHTARSAGP